MNYEGSVLIDGEVTLFAGPTRDQVICAAIDECRRRGRSGEVVALPTVPVSEFPAMRDILVV